MPMGLLRSLFLSAAIFSCIAGLSGAASATRVGTAAAGCGTVRDSVLYIKAGVKKLPDYAFLDRTDFREVVFETPVSIAEIGIGSFMGCTSLVGINLPANVRKIGADAFRECSVMTCIKLPQKLADIGSRAFIYCSALESIEFPASLKHIGSNAFGRCTSLREVKLPASITELESYAFAGCTALRSAQLPANSKLLGEQIFDGCYALEEITELSPTPPRFDCNSTLFSPGEEFMYTRCRLVTLPSATDLYRTAPGWNLFQSDEK